MPKKTILECIVCGGTSGFKGKYFSVLSKDKADTVRVIIPTQVTVISQSGTYTDYICNDCYLKNIIKLCKE